MSGEGSRAIAGDPVELFHTMDDWLVRRVDRLEFVDLTTIRRTITFTLDVDKLSIRGPRADVPLGLFRRHAGRAGTRVVDATGQIVPHQARAESDKAVRAWLERELSGRIDPKFLEGRPKFLEDRLTAIPQHGESECETLTAAAHGSGELAPGVADLASEKWGCPHVGALLSACVDRVEGEKAERIGGLLLDWQNNYLLVVTAAPDPAAPASGESVLTDQRLPAAWRVLTVTYEEELQEWLPPFERHRQAMRIRKRAEGPPPEDPGAARDDTDLHAPKAARAEEPPLRAISRGGPFKADLDATLPPSRFRRWAAASWWPRLRRLGRRGLGQTWHVAWEQWSAREVSSHHVEVALPHELAVVRMRLLPAVMPYECADGDERRANVANEVGGRAHVVAPTRLGSQQPARRPALVSLLVAHRDEGLWMGGALVAAVTGTVAVGSALLGLIPRFLDHLDAAVTTLAVVPTLVSTLLSIRAASDIAGLLTLTLRRLLLVVAVLPVALALVLVLTPGASPIPGLLGLESPREPRWVHWSWIVIGLLLLCACGLLLRGWAVARRLSQEASGRESRREPFAARGKRLHVGHRLIGGRVPTPPPDRWIEAGEGDRVPWGWFVRRDHQPNGFDADGRAVRSGEAWYDLPGDSDEWRDKRVDSAYWDAVGALYPHPGAVCAVQQVDVVEWVQRSVLRIPMDPPDATP